MSGLSNFASHLLDVRFDEKQQINTKSGGEASVAAFLKKLRYPSRPLGTNNVVKFWWHRDGVFLEKVNCHLRWTSGSRN